MTMPIDPVADRDLVELEELERQLTELDQALETLETTNELFPEISRAERGED